MRLFKAGILALLSILGVVQCKRAGQAVHPDPGVDHGAHGASSTMPSGYAPVTVDPNRLAALGLTTAKIEERDFKKTVRTIGVVAVDETRTAHVHAKVRGFLEVVRADFLGKQVKAGEPLCAIYSQGVLSAELELIALLKQPTSSSPEVDKSWQVLIEASRRRLMLWDVSKSEIARLERTLEPSRTFTIVSPRSGIVVARQAYVGIYVEPGTELYVISDLSKLWALVDVYEADVPSVKLGQPIRLTLEGSAAPIEAKVSFLAPTIDDATRTLKVRIDLDNSKGNLKPGAFATAEMDLVLGHGLGVPESAVIRTGTRNIVFAMHGTHAEPREVKLGPLLAGFYRVESGLSAGETVATGAQFLIDSESRLRATSTPAEAGHGGHGGH